ncbi:tRNA (uridine(34)/cytosine(34)/5-carboxymethylaminomethyluridine(34)-2'-O)-methyltransferase TrmL [Streptobacillus felis]|uniref:Putative tRNA (cytidine(34)-2'-O)-methyltransferase n=1 Tax=Streptobacillus felis TaxID=1384509 RepID=A0A7Z0PDL5_9FUSO|nr:tRNA (uridine(34)/cytosine(34)/5-carboxymethylaminomethyluridine(34)-2'-O)-methyltransferase TrmL [Streptobacillus felis]NYV27309.1 tRNA (uridine(34)/cytosine(34)/5-carboxymethylaminomethyluridine(34)-2'-O)-methyltransferase TrmL [Streptobacillus felis]
MNIVLFQPEMPYNTGNIGRSCVITNTTLHLIKPLGFEIDDKQVKRSGLDYWKYVDLKIWDSFEEFLANKGEGKIYFATTKTNQKYTDVTFGKNDYIMFGPESRGIPEEILNKYKDQNITIPMLKIGRSLNLSNSAVIILYEALRQQNFEFDMDENRVDEIRTELTIKGATHK